MSEKQIEEGPDGLLWRRVLSPFTVAFTHGPDGYWRGLPGSSRDAALPRTSKGMLYVEKAEAPGGGSYYRPLTPPQE